MANYKILKEFKDIHTKEIYKVDSTIEFTDSRAEEIESNLEQFGGGFIEPVKHKLKVDEIKSELDRLGVDYKDAKVKADFERLLDEAEKEQSEG